MSGKNLPVRVILPMAPRAPAAQVDAAGRTLRITRGGREQLIETGFQGIMRRGLDQIGPTSRLQGLRNVDVLQPFGRAEMANVDVGVGQRRVSFLDQMQAIVGTDDVV